MDLATRTGARILPVDSEHSAVFQALQAGRAHEVRRVVLTASGGPFRNHTREQLAHVTVEEALAHPTWNMGPKITVDSATMMNKALEIIEARWLFGLSPDQIGVMIHPQSVGPFDGRIHRRFGGGPTQPPRYETPNPVRPDLARSLRRNRCKAGLDRIVGLGVPSARFRSVSGTVARTRSGPGRRLSGSRAQRSQRGGGGSVSESPGSASTRSFPPAGTS